MTPAPSPPPVQGMGARRSLGRSGVEVTCCGLGSAPLGGLLGVVSEDAALATIDAAWDAGVRFFDTAPLYGHGTAERRLGRALNGRPRDDFVLATKVGRLLRRGAPPDPTQQHAGQPFYRGLSDREINPVLDYSADGVRSSIEESLDRLGLDRVDIAHVHDPDDYYEQTRDETIPALCEMRDEGLIRAVGVGVNMAAMPARLVTETDLDCVLIAGRYTLLDQSAADELLPRCVERGVGVIIGGVYNSGILANPDADDATYDYVPAPAEIRERAQRLNEVCRRHDVPLKAAAVQFPLAHPGVSSILLGTRSVDELVENQQLIEQEIPVRLWADLVDEDLLPGTVPIPKPAGTT